MKQVTLCSLCLVLIALAGGCHWLESHPLLCTPTTCEIQNKDCGAVADGCGGTLSCGECSAGEGCGGSGNPNVCSSVSSDAPGAPTGVVATAQPGSVTVSWIAPEDIGKGPIVGYRVTALPGGVTATTNGATSTTVTGLSAGTTYVFSVYAVNEVGSGPASLPSNPVTSSADLCNSTIDNRALICSDLLSERGAPQSLEIETGAYSICGGSRASDGTGHLLYSVEGAYGRINQLFIIDQDQKPSGSVLSYRLANVWPQRSGFQMVEGVGGGSSCALGFRHVDVQGKPQSEIPLGTSNCQTPVDERPDPTGGMVVAFASVDPDFSTIELRVWRFDAQGKLRFSRSIASWPAGNRGTDFVTVGTDLQGRTLVLFNGDASDGPHGTVGRWLDADGSDLTPTFAVTLPSLVEGDSAELLAPLISGGLALRIGGEWKYVFASGAKTPEAAPCWLAQRPGTNVQIVHGGKGYALFPEGQAAYPVSVCTQAVDILASDGTHCSQIPFDTSSSNQCTFAPLVIGQDGTVIAKVPGTHPSSNCIVRWWRSVFE